MALLSSQNPVRVTLVAGVAPIADDPFLSQTPSQGIVYGFREEGWWTSHYPAFGETNTYGDRNTSFVGNDLVDAFVQPSAERDAIWLAFTEVLRRHPLNADGELLNADFIIKRSLVGGASAARWQMDRSVDGTVLYAQVGQALQAYSMPDGGRLPALDEVLVEHAVRWDIKTAGNTKHVVQVVPNTSTLGTMGINGKVYYQGREIVDLNSLFEGNLAIPVYQVAVNVRSSEDPFFILTSTFGRERKSVTFNVDGLLVADVNIADALQFAVASDGKGTPFAQFNREPLDSGSTATVKALAQVTGQSVARLTEAQQGVFSEIREPLVEVSLQGVDPDFLLNGDWYFLHDDLTYVMREMATVDDTVRATFAVS